MQPAYNWQLDDLTHLRPLHGVRLGRVLAEGQVRAARVVMASEIWMPSFSNLPWIRGAPHRLASSICLTSLRTSGSMPDATQ
jgi:hypothetical protein